MDSKAAEAVAADFPEESMLPSRARRLRFWAMISAWVVALVLIAVVGGALREALVDVSPAVEQESFSTPTIYLTSPPSPAAATDQPPIDPAPASASVPAGAVAPHPQPAYRTLAIKLLALMPIKAVQSAAGYQRSKFGAAWLDVNNNGCDTRNDILRRDLSNVKPTLDGHDCLVQSGQLSDPYSGDTVVFDRKNPATVQIDQAVSLSDAWRKGGQGLSLAQRIAFANDPLNLNAVAAKTALSKHNADASAWLPTEMDDRCSYVARQLSVKVSYGLWLSQDEHDVMAAVLANCPQTLAPSNRTASSKQLGGPMADDAQQPLIAPESSSALPSGGQSGLSTSSAPPSPENGSEQAEPASAQATAQQSSSAQQSTPVQISPMSTTTPFLPTALPTLPECSTPPSPSASPQPEPSSPESIQPGPSPSTPNPGPTS
ncbi:hypothetical protein FHU41_001040 [Psychromicrobium silvestre]|uniref:GmrSD restriction endonucleases C-terminal domain-containing protein n=1 Tax=Psychromicrobium silvestre TaxID=1645614 RepID=A0A7Y9S5A5_9MICC|nr:HNH endonuclease family protein [Psychromicrobium silvestre]NYE94819.1 hypothetical protein [Psychromicrobium silvestre]